MKDSRIPVRIFVIWLVLALYVILHEGGHALAVLAFGGELTYFSVSILDARIRHISDLSQWEASVNHISGATLPYLVWIAFLLLVPARAGNRLLAYVKVYSVMVLGTMLPWLIIPILALYGVAPASDDVTRFLHASTIHPLVVSLVFAVLLAATLMLWLRKTPEFLQVIKFQDPPFRAGRRMLAGLIACSMLAVVLMSFSWVGKPGLRGGAGQIIAEVDLSLLQDGPHELATVQIEAGGTSQLFEVRFAEASAELLKLILVGLPGDTTTLIEFRKFSAGSSTQTQSVSLHPGTYRLITQTEQARGLMIVSK